MTKAQKYYVVWKGAKQGIFTSWEECKKQISGFPNAKYKSFPNRRIAEKAYEEGYENYKDLVSDFSPMELLPEQSELVGKPEFDSIAVDAACSGNPGILEYRGVETSTGKEIFRQGPFPEGTVNIGEFLALVHGLAYLKQKNRDVPIYSDSAIAMKWVRFKKARTKLEQNETNKALFDLVERAEKWLAENEYQNRILKWLTQHWGEIPADFGRK